MTFRSLVRAVPSLLLPVVLAGCGMGPRASAPLAAAPAIEGKVHGGQQPVSGANIQLYAIDTAGFGVAPYALLKTPVTTDAGGGFNITGDYACPSAGEAANVYLVATGGNPGLAAAVNNPQLALMTVLGPCGALSASSYISVNELTTVAAAYALAPWMTSPSSVVAKDSQQGAAIVAALGLAAAIADPATGVSPGTTPAPSGLSVPVTQLHTIANILAACINSSGGTGAGTACGSFLAATTPSGSLAPADTISALTNLARNPKLNTQALYGMMSASAPYQPSDVTQPSDLSLDFTGPTVQVSPASLTFATTALNSAAVGQTVSMTNTGTTAVSLTDYGLGGAVPQGYSLGSPSCTTIAAGATCTITVNFTPPAPGVLNASLILNGNANGFPAVIPITGTGAGTAPAAFTLSQSALSFSGAVGQTTAPQVVLLTNPGPGALEFETSRVGLNANDFALSGDCTIPLAAGASCHLYVTATPAGVGTRTAAIYFGTNATGTIPVLSLTANQSGAATLVASPAALSYSAAGVQTVAIANSGGSVATLSGINLTGTDAALYSQTNNCPLQLAAGGSCSVMVTFSPGAAGSSSANMVVTSNASDPTLTVGLSGTYFGAPFLTVTPGSVSFPDAPVGTTVVGPAVTIQNTGGTAATLGLGLSGANAVEFGEAATTCGAVLAAGASCTVTLTATPAAQGVRTGVMNIASNAANLPPSVALTVNGVVSNAPKVTLLPASIFFISAEPLPVTLTNTGTGALTISAISFGSSNFSEVDNCNGTVAAGASCLIYVTPGTTLGKFADTLTVVDNDTADAQTVALSSYIVGPPRRGAEFTAPGGYTLIDDSSGAFDPYYDPSDGYYFASNSVTITTSPNYPATGITGGTCGTKSAGGSAPGCDVSVTYSYDGQQQEEEAIATFLDGKVELVNASSYGTAAGFKLSSGPSLVLPLQTINTTANYSITLSSLSTKAMSLSTSLSTGALNTGDFSVSNGCSSVPTAAPNYYTVSTCTIGITYTPKGLGKRQTMLTITDVSGYSKTVLITASSQNTPPQVSPSSVSFGPTTLNSTASQSVSVTVPSGHGVSVAVGSASSGFTLASTTCSNSTASCSVTMNFSPTAVASYTGSLLVTDTVYNTTTTINLTGSGGIPNPVFTPASVDFGSVLRYSTPPALTATLSNTGTAPLNIYAYSTAVTTGETLTYNYNCPASLAAGASCTVSVQLSTTVTGPQSASLNVGIRSGSGDISLPVTINGTGAPSVSLSPAGLNFGTVAAGTSSATQAVTVTNSGNIQASLGINYPMNDLGTFSTGSTTCTSALAAGASCTINVRATPKANGAYGGTVGVGQGNTVTLTVTGTGAASNLTLVPNSLAFTTGTSHSTSQAQLLTVQNLGSTPVNVSGVTFGGSMPGDYSQTNNCSGGLVGGGSCTIIVTNTPTVTTATTASLTVLSDQPPATASLTSTGQGNIGYTANLTWSVTYTYEDAVITNYTPVPVTITSLAIVNGSAVYFTASSNTCGTAGTVTLPAGGSCTVTILNQGGGAPANGSIQFKTSDNPSTTFTIPLSATPALNLISTTYTFKDVAVGGLNKQTILDTYYNFPVYAWIGDPEPADFSYNPGVQVCNASACNVVEGFTPTVVGARQTKLYINMSGGQNLPGTSYALLKGNGK